MMWIITIILAVLFLWYQSTTIENYDLSAGFVDLASYGEIDKYLYKNFIKIFVDKGKSVINKYN